MTIHAMIRFTRVKALWPERKGFHLVRKNTGDEYIFLHLLTPCEIVINGKQTKAKEGACILYNKNDCQDFASPACELMHDYFHAAGELDELMRRYGLRFSHLYYPRYPERITMIIQKIEQEYLKKSPFYEQYAEAALHELLILLARSSEAPEESALPDSRMYERFISLRKEIHDRFDRSLSVDEMAAMVNLSPSRFYSVYKSIFGVSPKKDYLNIRIEHAKTLLLQGNFTVAQVASMTGYSNPYHFIRQFRELTGCTPGKFQKDLRSMSGQ